MGLEPQLCCRLLRHGSVASAINTAVAPPLSSPSLATYKKRSSSTSCFSHIASTPPSSPDLHNARISPFPHFIPNSGCRRFTASSKPPPPCSLPQLYFIPLPLPRPSRVSPLCRLSHVHGALSPAATLARRQPPSSHPWLGRNPRTLTCARPHAHEPKIQAKACMHSFLHNVVASANSG